MFQVLWAPVCIRALWHQYFVVLFVIFHNDMNYASLWRDTFQKLWELWRASSCVCCHARHWRLSYDRAGERNQRDTHSESTDESMDRICQNEDRIFKSIEVDERSVVFSCVALLWTSSTLLRTRWDSWIFLFQEISWSRVCGRFYSRIRKSQRESSRIKRRKETSFSPEKVSKSMKDGKYPSPCQ